MEDIATMMTPETQNRPLGCDFFLKTPTEIFTPESFSGDSALMIRSAEEFSRKEILPIQERIDAQEEGLMPELVRKAGEMGFCGADTAEAYGGLGLDKNLAARMLEFLSLNASFSVTIGITSGISQVGLNLFGTEAQRQQYLPPLTSGEQIGAYALSEPNSGSDALSMTSRAEQKGDKWILNGTKMWISNAKWADQFLVMAKINGEKVSAFIVEKDFPGVSVAREEHKMGLKGSSTARLILENAEVPLENLLHEEGKGHQVAFNALNIGRFKLASMSIGPAREAINLAVAYSQDRKQFGKSISEFGLIQKKMADMAAWFYGAESMIYRTGDGIDQAFKFSGGTADGNRKAAEEFAVECSACKVMATELEGMIIDEALQVYGGYGFTEEFPIARIYRDSRVSKIYEGTNEINRIFLADRFMKKMVGSGLALEPVGDSFVSELAGRAFSAFTELYGSDNFGKNVPQVHLGALSDLLMLTYAEQSSRLRASQNGGVSQDLHSHFLTWVNQQAARAYQTAMNEAVMLPEPEKYSFDAIVDATLTRRTPFIA
jgi:alkylation response protein AidB-like acyl-CoA dehydrogenase